MRVQRRTTPIWGLVFLGIAGVLLARAVGIVPDGLYDLVVRAWPALVVLLGLLVLLRDRLPFSGLIALVLTTALVIGVAFYAFNTRAAQPRVDNVQTIAQSIPLETTLLRVRVLALATDVELRLALAAAANVTGTYTGGRDNRVDITLDQAADNSMTLTLQEARTSEFPFLETVGRGVLQLELPSNVPLDVEFANQDGDITLNLSGTQLERLNVNAVRGNVLLTLPSYQPRFSGRGDNLGVITAQDGDLTLRVPSDVAARLQLNRAGSGIQPQYDDQRYLYLQGDILQAADLETADNVVFYTLTAPRGLIRLDVAQAAGS